MKRMMKTTGWLVMAAALTIGAIACQSDDTIIEPQPQAGVKTVHITAGASLSDGITRSAIYQDPSTKKRTLQLTAGDKIYVRATITGTDPEKIVAGYLDIDATSISTDKMNAQFSGDLTVYKDNGTGAFTASEHLFTTADPLGSECTYIEVRLAQKDALDNSNFVVNSSTMYAELAGYDDLTATAEDCMMRLLNITGSYDASTKLFSLSVGNDQPVYSCTVNGLIAGASYQVTYISDGSGTTFPTAVTATTGGTATFAFLGDWTGSDMRQEIRLTNTADATDVYFIYLGYQYLESKVYNVTRTFAKPTLTGITITPDDCTYTINSSSYNFTIGGNSKGFSYYFGDAATEGTVTLADGGSATYEDSPVFTFSAFPGTATFNLAGAFTINCPGYWSGIEAMFADVKLGGNGTLTIVCSDEDKLGIISNNFTNAIKSALNPGDEVPALAASGSTVTYVGKTKVGGLFQFVYTINTP